MEYKITLATPVSHEDIVAAVRQWLRCTDVGQPMGGTNALFPQPWGRPGSSAADPFGLNRAGLGFGSSSRGPSAFSTALLASPTHNIFSSHYLQTRGEVTIGPNVTLQQMSEMGRRQSHYFVVNEREMLVVEQNSLHHQWVRLPANWNRAVSNPTVSTPVSYRSAAGTGAPLDVARMTEGQKLWEAIERGTAQLPAQSAELIKGIFTPQGIALMLVIAAVVALGGEFVALGVLLFGVGMGLWDLVTNVFDLVKKFYQTAVNARTEQELDQAGAYLAEALLKGGLDVLDIFCAPAALGRLRVLARGRTITPRVVWTYLEERYRLLVARRATGGRAGAEAAAETEQVARRRRTGPDRWRQEPNSTYTRNGYTYSTDAQGRIISAEGDLRLQSAPRNQYDQQNVGRGDGRLDGDAGGHLIGSQFGGVGTRENMTAMNHAQVNAYPNGEFGRLENRWAGALNNGSDVRVRVEPVYAPGNTTSRPDSYEVTEWIDGRRTTYDIINHRP